MQKFLIVILFLSGFLNNLSGQIINTIAGNGIPGFSGDGGAATSASLSKTKGTATDNLGNIYVADLQNYRVRKITPGGIISTIAGNGITLSP